MCQTLHPLPELSPRDQRKSFGKSDLRRSVEGERITDRTSRCPFREQAVTRGLAADRSIQGITDGVANHSRKAREFLQFCHPDGALATERISSFIAKRDSSGR